MILIKVEVNGFMYSYQYKGTVGSSILLSATTVLPSTTTTSSDTSNVPDTATSITINNINYQRISETILNQSYIQQYLNYLETTDICYQRKNLIGVFTNPQIANSFFFRYRNNTQYYNIFTSSSDIQKTLTNYLKTKEQSAQSGQTQQTVVQTTSQATTIQSNQPAQPIQQVQPAQPVQTTPTTQTVQSTQQSSEGSSTSSSSSTSKVVQQQQQSSFVQQSVVVPQVTQTSSTVRKSVAEVDPNCLCYDRERCLKCSHRFYLNNNQCIQVPAECQSYDQLTGTCLKCLPGFALNSGLCRLEDVAAYFIEGQCVSCFGNYRLVNKRCVYVPVTNVSSPEYIQAKNPLCFSWNGQRCVDCLPGTFLSSRGICELVDPFCSVFDYVQ